MTASGRVTRAALETVIGRLEAGQNPIHNADLMRDLLDRVFAENQGEHVGYALRAFGGVWLVLKSKTVRTIQPFFGRRGERFELRAFPANTAAREAP